VLSFYNYKVHFDLFKEMSLSYAKRNVFPTHMRVHFTSEEIIKMMLTDLNLEIIEVDKSNFLIFVFKKD